MAKIMIMQNSEKARAPQIETIISTLTIEQILKAIQEADAGAVVK